jgi:hypothetical protein
MTDIRPEARPVNWNALDKGQQDALTRILKMIDCALPKEKPKPPGTYHSHKPYISEDRSSRLAFLDGGRGTGKSTILVTLLKFINEGVHDPSEIHDPSDKNRSEEIVTIINNIHKHVVWLEPIDMEPTPKNWNMLPAILARIEQAYNRYCRQSKEDESYQSNNYGGLLDPSRNYHDAMQELRQLQNNVALSWNGNLNDRAAQLDPDSYALETMRIEQARLELNPNIEKVLDSIAYAIGQSNKISNPLFILPIDDFDLNPVVCLELLRILRMLSVPRLFTLMLGDLEMVDVVLNLKISNDLNSICPQIREEMLSITSSYVAMTAGRVAADSIHKLLPPMQCIQLRPMHSFEALNFCPLNEPSDSDKPFLYQKLEDCPITFGEHITKRLSPSSRPPYGVKNIAGFLIAKGLPVISSQQRKTISQCQPSGSKLGTKSFLSEDIVNTAFYSGIQMMNTIPRYVTDIWFTFNRFIEYKNKANNINQSKKREFEVKWVAELCQNILLRDGALDPITRSQTRSGFFNNHLDGWDLEALPVTTRSVLDNGISTPHLKNPYIDKVKTTENLQCHFNAFKAMGWRFQLTHTPQEKTASEIQADLQTNDVHGIQYHQLGKDFISSDHLGTDTSGALIFFHDLLALGPTYRSHSFS